MEDKIVSEPVYSISHTKNAVPSEPTYSSKNTDYSVTSSKPYSPQQIKNPPKKKSKEEMIKEARRKNNIKMKYYNIAIIGQSGVGKSTIVNGIRGLYPNGKDAAKEGDLEETTQ